MADKATPRYDVFVVTERKNRPAYWCKIGGAFEFTTEKGEEGLNIYLHALPPDGKLTLLTYRPPPAKEEPQA